MIKEETEYSSGSPDCGRGVVVQNDAVNGLAIVEYGIFTSGNSGGFSQESLKTYKRRRYTNMNSSQAKILENGNIAVNTFRQLPDKTSVPTCEDIDKLPSLPGEMNDRTHKSAKVSLSVTCNGSSCKSSCSNTDLCGRVFHDIVMSEKFTQLCDLLWKNFEGVKVDSLQDIHRINLKMKEGAYEKSPMLFHSDMQKVWEHFRKVGAEINSLSKSLMDKSKDSFSHQFSKSDIHTKLEQMEACGVPKACTCQQCGEKAEGRDYLVCDSCEEMYHISCIEPAVEEIPTKSWYCINCVAIGIESPHDNCVVCEKLNARVDHEDVSMEFEENSNGLPNYEIELRNGGNICNICKIEVRIGTKIKVCGHSLCPHRCYHMNCLTNKQLSTYGPCWYCPSCLCRACLTDRDDHKIVLCDGCDSAYHIYCMQPPHTTIPQGSWFCKKCDVGIQKIAKAERVYGRIQSKLTKRVEDGEVIVDEVIGKSGGVDMLLSAARTLKFKEEMA